MTRSRCRHRQGVRGGIVSLVAAGLALAILAGPAVAARPPVRSLPAHTLTTTDAAHAAFMARLAARHGTAVAGSSAAPAVRPARAALRRGRHPVAIGPEGSLAVATLAAVCAIMLVALSVAYGERDAVARRSRRRTREAPPVHKMSA